MANLASLKRSSTALTTGAWKRPDPDLDLQILTRGYTDEYQDAQASKQRKAAKGFGGDPEKLPVALKRSINIECLIKHCLIDVKMKDDDGAPVTFEEFCDTIRDPDFSELATAAFTAAGMVSADREADAKEAEGN
ncbi:hypothetical protein ABNQ39_06930 [Azospirillum sp. A26]|uniref:hypothetical protein n=1 Tax=Azospirillum sp. A26 TaxID=3160607 RepID=UPI003670B038